jgi:hypothetical protein
MALGVGGVCVCSPTLRLLWLRKKLGWDVHCQGDNGHCVVIRMNAEPYGVKASVRCDTQLGSACYSSDKL